MIVDPHNYAYKTCIVTILSVSNIAKLNRQAYSEYCLDYGLDDRGFGAKTKFIFFTASILTVDPIRSPAQIRSWGGGGGGLFPIRKTTFV
jgi:hypothetical protein